MFIPEQRNRYVFSNFEILILSFLYEHYVYMLPTFNVHFTHLAHSQIMDMQQVPMSNLN